MLSKTGRNAGTLQPQQRNINNAGEMCQMIHNDVRYWRRHQTICLRSVKAAGTDHWVL